MSNGTELARTIGCRGGWEKFPGNPVMGTDGDFRFDNHVLRTETGYRMYFSWRKHYAIAVSESADGLSWSEPELVLTPRPETGWEDDVNRPAIVYRDGLYQMWYSGQTAGKEFSSADWTEVYLEAAALDQGTSAIGYATSEDGYHWQRRDTPVLKASAPWEKQSLMCPTVLWDEAQQQYRIWYSGGGWFEPDALGYAESADGVHWTRPYDTPVFGPDPTNIWEEQRVAGPQVLQHDGWYYLFYIGYEDMFKARVCLARSRDGVTGWQRHPENPILSPGLPGAWDSEAVYKPFAVFDEPNDRWLMWFNARTGTTERIGLATHQGADLWSHHVRPIDDPSGGAGDAWAGGDRGRP